MHVIFHVQHWKKNGKAKIYEAKIWGHDVKRCSRCSSDCILFSAEVVWKHNVKEGRARGPSRLMSIRIHCTCTYRNRLKWHLQSQLHVDVCSISVLWISVSYRGWDFPPLTSSFPPQALLTLPYTFPTPMASSSPPSYLKNYDSVWDSVWNCVNNSWVDALRLMMFVLVFLTAVRKHVLFIEQKKKK